MVRIKSEMFENFSLIAEKSGLTKLAAESDEHKKYKDDAEARAGSDDISTIEALYGVKPDGQDYKFNIMEQAHPNSVIIAPSYDKTNGLVENNIERQNIMINLTLKNPLGTHTNPKYAQKELVMELVRIANEMDNKNKEELFKLADSCLIDLSASKRQARVKKAVAPAAAAGLPIAAITIGVALALGAVWLVSHSDDTDNGPLANCDNALKKLQDLKTNSWFESDVDATVRAECDTLIDYIYRLKEETTIFLDITDEIYKPKSLSELQEIIKVKQSIEGQQDTIANGVQTFKAFVMEVAPLINQSIANFTDSTYQKQHTKPSAISEMTGWLGEALHGRWGLISNDFISAANALAPLKKSIEELTDKVKDFKGVVAKYEQDIKMAMDTGESKSHAPTSVKHNEKTAPQEDESSFLNHIKNFSF